jgi:hypothetical protein
MPARRHPSCAAELSPLLFSSNLNLAAKKVLTRIRQTLPKPVAQQRIPFQRSKQSCVQPDRSVDVFPAEPEQRPDTLADLFVGRHQFSEVAHLHTSAPSSMSSVNTPSQKAISTTFASSSAKRSLRRRRKSQKLRFQMSVNTLRNCSFGCVNNPCLKRANGPSFIVHRSHRRLHAML